jgi:hypothetical protein
MGQKGVMNGFAGVGGRNSWVPAPKGRTPYGFFFDLHPQVSHIEGTSGMRTPPTFIKPADGEQGAGAPA